MRNSLNQLDHINYRIEQALKKSHHSAAVQPDKKVLLLAVSKRHPLEKILVLYEQGQRDFGESYVQEALQKIQQCPYKDIVWHFIGPIQSNKTRDIAEHFQWVHSVDRLKIAQRLSAQRPENLPDLNICLQINISEEPQKSGFSPTEVFNALENIISLPHLKVRGLMAIPRPENEFEQQRIPFHRLNELMHKLNEQFKLNMDTLSMGMSGDLEAAIAEGATIVRIGTALFGPRDT